MIYGIGNECKIHFAVSNENLKKKCLRKKNHSLIVGTISEYVSIKNLTQTNVLDLAFIVKN